jgi:DNA-binding FrmR family transcriptional regulator
MEGKRKQVMDRFKRIEGQLRGLQNMLASEGRCEDILIQVAAVTAAMKRAGAAVVQAYLEECLEKARQEPEAALADFRKVVTRYMDLA